MDGEWSYNYFPSDLLSCITADDFRKRNNNNNQTVVKSESPETLTCVHLTLVICFVKLCVKYSEWLVKEKNGGSDYVFLKITDNVVRTLDKIIANILYLYTIVKHCTRYLLDLYPVCCWVQCKQIAQ